MTDDLQGLVLFLLERAAEGSPALVRASSIWTLEKLYPAFHTNSAAVLQCLKLIFSGMLGEAGKGGEGSATAVLMVKEASISFLDAIVSHEELSEAMSA